MIIDDFFDKQDPEVMKTRVWKQGGYYWPVKNKSNPNYKDPEVKGLYGMVKKFVNGAIKVLQNKKKLVITAGCTFITLHALFPHTFMACASLLVGSKGVVT